MRHISRILLTVILSATILLAAVIAVQTITARIGRQKVTATVDKTRIEIDAKLAGGKGSITAGPVTGAPPDIAHATLLSSAVHIELKNASLEGQATLTVHLPGNTRPPEGAVFIYTRSAQTENKWVWAGGAYNARARTVTIQTTHFSDWVVGAINPEQILQDQTEAQQIHRRFVLDTLVGHAPPLTCPTDARLEYIAIKDIPPEVKACMTRVGTSNLYRLELANSHNYPLLLQLPAAVHAHPYAATGDGAVADAWRGMYAGLSGKLILEQQGKTVLLVDKTLLPKGDTITGSISWSTTAVNLAETVFEIATRGLSETILQTKDGANALQASLEKATASKKVLDCSDSLLNKLTDTMRHDKGASDAAVAVAFELTSRCYGPTVDSALAGWQTKIGVRQPQAGGVWGFIKKVAAKVVGVARTVGRIVNVFADIKDIGKRLRELLAASGVEGFSEGQEHSIADMAVKLSVQAGSRLEEKKLPVQNHCTYREPTAENKQRFNGHGQRMETLSVAYGDVTGDGQKDALAVTSCESTTSSWPEEVQVFDGASPDLKKIKLLDIVEPTGDAGYSRAITAAAGTDGKTLIITGQALSEDAPLCCADLQFTQRFTWNTATKKFAPAAPDISPLPN